MKILAVGGGSGGHVTPVVAVFKEIIKKNKNVELRFWCDKKFLPQAEKTMKSAFGSKVKISSIHSGKFRRYHHLNLFQHLMSPRRQGAPDPGRRADGEPGHADERGDHGSSRRGQPGGQDGGPSDARTGYRRLRAARPALQGRPPGLRRDGLRKGELRMFETLRTALSSLLANKTRSLLTMLGVVIGVGAVIAMVAVGNGASVQMQELVSSPL